MGTKYATARELKGMDRELDSLRAIEGDPYKFGSIEDKGQFRRRKKQIEERVEKETPPAIKDDAERKRLEERAEQLASYMLHECKDNRKPAMTTQYEEWERPSGAVGKHRQWNDKVNNWTITTDGKVTRSKYGAMAEWKDIQSRLVPRDEQEIDPDYRSFEKLRPQNRPSSAADYPRTQFAPGSGMTQEQWDASFGTDDKAESKVGNRARSVEEQCTAIKKDGTLCVARRLPGIEFCVFHRPKE